MLSKFLIIQNAIDFPDRAQTEALRLFFFPSAKVPLFHICYGRGRPGAMKGRNRHKLAMVLVGPAATSWCYAELGLSHWLGIDPSHACLAAVAHDFSSRGALKASLGKHDTRMILPGLWALEAAALSFKKKNELGPWLVSIHTHFFLFPLFPSSAFFYPCESPELPRLPPPARLSPP